MICLIEPPSIACPTKMPMAARAKPSIVAMSMNLLSLYSFYFGQLSDLSFKLYDLFDDLIGRLQNDDLLLCRQRNDSVRRGLYEFYEITVYHDLASIQFGQFNHNAPL